MLLGAVVAWGSNENANENSRKETDVEDVEEKMSELETLML
jgi:hypothetical protein